MLQQHQAYFEQVDMPVAETPAVHNLTSTNKN
jgi:hypothetical protein